MHWEGNEWLLCSGVHDILYTKQNTILVNAADYLFLHFRSTWAYILSILRMKNNLTFVPYKRVHTILTLVCHIYVLLHRSP